MKRRGIWIAAAIALGLIVAGGAALGVVGFLRGTDPPPPPPRLAIAPEVELPWCPVVAPPPLDSEGNERIRVMVLLTTTSFTLAATDGTQLATPYEGDAYPFAALREHLAERRSFSLEERDLAIKPEPGVPPQIATRVLELARETGFTRAVLCREPTELDWLTDEELARRRRAQPAQPATDPMTELGNLMGDGPAAGGGTGEGTIGLGNLGTIGNTEEGRSRRAREGD